LPSIEVIGTTGRFGNIPKDYKQRVIDDDGTLELKIDITAGMRNFANFVDLNKTYRFRLILEER
jgi:hypothetical protein